MGSIPQLQTCRLNNHSWHESLQSPHLLPRSAALPRATVEKPHPVSMQKIWEHVRNVSSANLREHFLLHPSVTVPYVLDGLSFFSFKCMIRRVSVIHSSLSYSISCTHRVILKSSSSPHAPRLGTELQPPFPDNLEQAYSTLIMPNHKTIKL